MPGVCERNPDIFYLGSKVLFRLLPLSSLLEFTVFSDFHLS